MIIGDKNVYKEAIPLYDKLASLIKKETWNSITLCSAFLTKAAAQSIIELINEIKNKTNIKITIIIGIKNNFTEPDAIDILIDYIGDNKRSNFDLKIRLPRDINFHMKCYVFLGVNGGNALVGSANLTDTGLASRGELMIEVNDDNTVNTIVTYIDHYLNESENWHDCINKYKTIYEKCKPAIKKINTSSLFKKINLVRRKTKLTIRYTAPTMEVLGIATKEQEASVAKIFDSVKEQFLDIIKSYWITFSEYEDYGIDEIREKYPIGSCFDRPRDINRTWEIGTKRMICYVGAIVNILDDEIVMFMKKGCTHYSVTEEIIKVAESLGIKSDGEDDIPTKQEMDEYRKFILGKRVR